MDERKTSQAAARWAYAADRLPGTLDELSGPVAGTVELPLHLAWSGLRAFDLENTKLLLGMYRIVLNNGLREDFVEHLDAERLVAHWPILRKMLGRGVRTVWEDAFAELRQVDAA
ncbi:hypothetical protein AB0F96_13875 [Streptomyces sp. NPDC023998]|uniref:hypothetical protein n=1 Tax=Streptomyces sp. NPDC023998 TaxID=3154597 RepID=UPI0033FC4175